MEYTKEFFARKGRKGGLKLKKERGIEYYRKIGKMGADKKKENKLSTAGVLQEKE